MYYFIFALTSPEFQKIFLSTMVGRLKKKYWKDEDLEVARMKKWGECGSNKKLLCLVFLPSFRGAPEKKWRETEVNHDLQGCIKTIYIYIEYTVSILLIH